MGSQDGKKITDESLLSLLKDKYLNDFSPTKLQIEIIRGPFEFSLNISSQYDGVLEVNLKMDNENIADDINYALKKWIKQYKPKRVHQIWSSFDLGFVSSVFIILLLISISSVIMPDRSLYKAELLKKSEALLNNGISNTEVCEALEVILELESGHVPKSFKPEVKIDKTFVKVSLILIFIVILLSIKPRTTIGLGKKERIAKFYKVWINIVLIFIPASIILPIIIGNLF